MFVKKNYDFKGMNGLVPNNYACCVCFAVFGFTIRSLLTGCACQKKNFEKKKRDCLFTQII